MSTDLRLPFLLPTLAPPVVVVPPVTLPQYNGQGVRINPFGDSITALGYPDDYPTLLRVAYGSTAFTVDNTGHAGDRVVPELQSRYAAAVTQTYDSTKFLNVLLVMAGINDLLQPTPTPLDTLIPAYKKICQDAIAQGHLVLVATMLPNATPGVQTLVDAFNARLRAEALGWGVAKIYDAAVEPGLTDPANRTYYTDVTHPSPLGKHYLARGWKRTLDPLLIARGVPVVPYTWDIDSLPTPGASTPVVTNPTTGTAGNLLRVTATYPTAPASPVVAFDKMPFGLTQIWNQTSDDGYVGDLKVIAPVLFGGTVTHMNGRDPLLDANGQPITTTYPGVKFPDGCGKMVQAGFGTALNGGAVPATRDPYYGDKLAVADFLTLCQQDGYDPISHTYLHTFDADGDGPDNAYLELKNNYDWGKTNLNRSLRMFTIPGGLAGGTGPAFDNADLHILRTESEGFQDSDKYFREVAGSRISPDRYGWPNGDTNYHWSDQTFFDRNFNEARMLNWQRQLVSRANHDGSFTPANVQNFRAWADDAVNWLNTNQVRAQSPFFTHSMDWSQADTFAACCNYMLNHPNLTGRAGILNSHQCAEYAEAIALSVIGPVTVSGNTLTFDIDQSAIPAVSRYLNLTLNLPAGATSVTVQGATDFSYNAQGLVNVYKKRGETSPNPVPSTGGARITGTIPVNTDLEFTSLQAPAIDFYKKAFTPGTTVNEDPSYYNGRYRTADNQRFNVTRYKPPKGQNPVIRRITASDTRPYGIELRMVEVKANKTEVELFHFNQDLLNHPFEWLGQTAPDSTYRLELIGANAMASLRFEGDYIDVPYPALPARPKFQAKNFTLLHTFDFQLMNGGQLRQPFFSVWSRFGGGRVYSDQKHTSVTQNETIFNIDTSGINQDLMQQEIQKAGALAIMDYKQLPSWLQDTYKPADSNTEIPPVVPAYANRKNLASWAWLRNYAYNIFARGGNNANIDLSTLNAKTNQLYAGDTRYVYTRLAGLGLLKLAEFLNETDGDFKPGDWSPGGFTTYMTGAEYAYCIYSLWLAREDAGGKALTGIELSTVGLALVSPDYLMDCLTELHEVIALQDPRAANLIPWDYVQVHFYSTTGSGVQNTGATSRGARIELSSAPERFARFLEVNDRLLGGKPLIIGERGYCWKINYRSNADGTPMLDANGNQVEDTSQGGQSGILVRPPAGSGLTQKQYQAQLSLAETAWYASQGNIAKAVNYQATDDTPDQPYQTYSSCGFIEVGTDANGNETAVLRENGNLQVQWHDLIGEYVHETNLSESPRVGQWRHPVTGKLLWTLVMVSETNATGSYPLNVPANYSRYDFDFNSDTPRRAALSQGNNTIGFGELLVVIGPSPS